MRLPYYGQRLDDETLEGRVGAVARALNRTRLFVQRQAEIVAAVVVARRQGDDLVDCIDRLVDEGIWAPVEVITRPAVEPAPPDDPEVESRFYKSRDYQARVGRSTDRIMRDAELGITEDKTTGFFRRYGIGGQGRPARARRYGLPVVVRETFIPVGRSS